LPLSLVFPPGAGEPVPPGIVTAELPDEEFVEGWVPPLSKAALPPAFPLSLEFPPGAGEVEVD